MSDDRAATAEEEDVVDEEQEPEADESEPEADAGEEDAGDGDEGEEPGDAGEADAEAGAEPESVEDRAPPRRGANETIRRLRERAQRAERERDEARRQQPQPVQPRETPQQRQERLALMDPEQRTQYLLDEQSGILGQRLQQIERYTLAQGDRTSFDRLCDRDPACAAVADWVETEFQRILAEGRFVTREALANYKIGENVRKRGGKAAGQQRRRGAERIARERTRAPGGRSDVAAERRPRADSAEARERRLKDQEI